jgi:hypothetical protein
MQIKVIAYRIYIGFLRNTPIIKKYYRKRIIERKRNRFKGLSNQEIFSAIYENKLWGVDINQPGDFYSGTGSYSKMAEDYVNLISNFIKKENIHSITDIGCGDFSIGRKIVENNKFLFYLGCDVVPKLIDRNIDLFSSENVKFKCIDASVDEIPQSDLLTIRQVLQHLNNTDIIKIMLKAKAFKYCIVTEHQLRDNLVRKFNKDKPTGSDIRIVDYSGVYLDKSPFDLKITELGRSREDSPEGEAYIVTYLINW